MSIMSPQQYRPSSRSWVKLWVNEWLTGTVRWQLTPQQRSIWADLLALAGRSRYPGLVCSGETNGVLSPFPMDYLCSVFRCSEPDVQEAFRLFVEQGRIVIDGTGVIQIVSWDKYQSEYQQKRQRTVYKNATQSLPNVRRKSSVEVEVEGDGDKKRKPRPSLESAEFKAFWELYPKKVAKVEAVKAWEKMTLFTEPALILQGLERWKQSEQWQEMRYIPYPATFLNQRRWSDEVPSGKVVSKHEQSQRNTLEAARRTMERHGDASSGGVRSALPGGTDRT